MANENADKEAARMIAALWPLIEAELARQRQAGREDAAYWVEGFLKDDSTLPMRTMVPPAWFWEDIVRVARQLGSGADRA